MKYLDPKADPTFKKIFGNHPDRLRNLLYVLQSPSEDELIHLQQYLPSVEELEISGFTDAELRAYDKFWDSVRVEKTLQYDSYQQGMEKGIKQGMAKGEEVGKSQRSIEIAKNMLLKGMDAATVMEITGLTESQMQQLM